MLRSELEWDNISTKPLDSVRMSYVHLINRYDGRELDLWRKSVLTAMACSIHRTNAGKFKLPVTLAGLHNACGFPDNINNRDIIRILESLIDEGFIYLTREPSESSDVYYFGFRYLRFVGAKTDKTNVVNLKEFKGKKNA